MTHQINEVLSSFLHIVDIFSDKAFQERVWIKAEGPECHDMDDAYDDFFPFVDEILDQHKKYGVLSNQRRLILELRNKLREFDDKCYYVKPYKTEEELINLPMWQEVRDLAKKVCKNFNYKRKPFIG